MWTHTRSYINRHAAKKQAKKKTWDYIPRRHPLTPCSFFPFHHLLIIRHLICQSSNVQHSSPIQPRPALQEACTLLLIRDLVRLSSQGAAGLPSLWSAKQHVRVNAGLMRQASRSVEEGKFLGSCKKIKACLARRGRNKVTELLSEWQSILHLAETSTEAREHLHRDQQLSFLAPLENRGFCTEGASVCNKFRRGKGNFDREEAKELSDSEPLITFLTSKGERWRRATEVMMKKCDKRLPSCLPPEERKAPDVCEHQKAHKQSSFTTNTHARTHTHSIKAKTLYCISGCFVWHQERQRIKTEENRT